MSPGGRKALPPLWWRLKEEKYEEESTISFSSAIAVITAADGILSDPALRSRLVYRLYLSTNSYLMIIFDSFAYETFKDENLKIISSMLDELKITLIQQKAVNK